ncbi:MAG TPA: hypothetical protein VF121_15925 [Thermoanaerobaculia bacterium]|nr:hypothetical protein [Thermoanaerobaculia bacterium]
MDPAHRRAFNAAFREEKYRAVMRQLEAELGFPVDFRISETPIFLTAELTAELIAAAHTIVAAVTAPDYLTRAGRAVPPELAVPGEEGQPPFVQVDFALAEGDGGHVVPQLIELQAFPSLYGFQWLLDRVYREHYDIAPGLTTYFDGLDEESYAARLRETIVADCDPEEVVLLEIEPERQKTRADFAATERMLGIRSVDLRELAVREGRVSRRRDGREVPVRRIYNRVIFDELVRRGLPRAPLFTEPLDAAWVGHPNWYFRVSKFSLPFLDFPWAPRAHFVSDLPEPPPDLGDYVLKPLFSFAGLGVELDVTHERLRALPRPEEWIL